MEHQNPEVNIQFWIDGSPKSKAWILDTLEEKLSEPELELESIEERNSISHDQFFIARNHYEPLWGDNWTNNVIFYNIDRQVQLSSGCIQVTFSIGEETPGRDSEIIYRFRGECLVTYDVAKGRWVIEEHEGPAII